MAVATLVIASGVFGACSSIPPAPSTTRPPVSVPQGWKNYSYGRATISAPDNWVVQKNTDCPIRTAPGTLNLGTGGGNAPCTTGFVDANAVSLSSLPSGNGYVSSCPPIKMNGLLVYVGPCSSSDAAGIVLYSIPSLRVQAEGTGISSEDVTGPGTGTIVGRVLHTLRG
jgi:hypothetical protein